MFLSLLVLPGLVACGVGRGPATVTRDDRQVEVTLRINRQRYREGEPVQINFTLQNVTDEKVILERTNGPVVDLVIYSPDEELLWSEDAENGRVIREIQLERLEKFEISWLVDSLPRGNYGVSGTWWSHGARESSVAVAFSYGPIER